MLPLVILFIIVSALCAALVLNGVTLWHKREVPKAILYVGSGFFLSIMTMGFAVRGAILTLAEVIQQMPPGSLPIN